MRKRITIEIDLDDLSFTETAAAASALQVLEELCRNGLAVMESQNLQGRGRLRKPRTDRKDDDDRELQPQSREVLKYLKDRRPRTVDEIAFATSIPSNSVRAHLNLLKRRKLVTLAGTVPANGKRPANLWQSLGGE